MAEATVWTVQKILNWTQQYFGSKGVDNPRLDAEILLCDILGCRRLDLFLRLQEVLDKPVLDRYHTAVVRRARREPVAYILGRKAFLKWDFKVTKDVLIPRPETELLVENIVRCVTGKSLTQLEKEAFWRKKAAETRALADKTTAAVRERLKEETDPDKARFLVQEVTDQQAAAEEAAARGTGRDGELAGHALRVLDVGTGSGAILLSLLALLPDAQGTGVDVSPAALAVARENGETLGVPDRVEWLCSDLCAAIPAGRQYDVIVSNPPYIPARDMETLQPEVRQEPVLALAGGEDGLDVYRRLLRQLPAFLAQDGLAAFEVGIGEGRAVASFCRRVGLTETAVCLDFAGIDRMVFAARPESRYASAVANLRKEQGPEDRTGRAEESKQSSK
ncbi:MAG: N5-glutamine methyltransferase family protein [Succiniclasticum sp.]|jgi:release factor glutamine methyltransferase